MNIQPNTIIIGKRIPLGAAIGAVATVFANVFPDHAASIVAGSTAVIFIAQIIVVNWIGVTK